jgi:patatin-like phospholipase/acyl hydrolase
MKRILTIDGGGAKGIFPASFLATIEDCINDKISNYFDLIAGTSTGGIIALGLGLGFSAKEILEFYEKLVPTIFKGNRFLRTIRWLGCSKYSQKPLKQSLESKFGDKKLGESTKRLIIPSMNLENGEVHLYKTSHHPRFERDFKEKVTRIALATAAAPTYFPTARSQAGTPLIDGGMWANDPTGLAVVEAIGVLGWLREDLRILSLGCTTEPLDIKRGRQKALGAGYWGVRIADVFMKAQSFGTQGTAKILVGEENIVRINPMLPKGRFAMDGTIETDSLKGLGNYEARKAISMLRKKQFFGQKAESFTPYHQLQ